MIKINKLGQRCASDSPQTSRQAKRLSCHNQGSLFVGEAGWFEACTLRDVAKDGGFDAEVGCDSSLTKLTLKIIVEELLHI